MTVILKKSYLEWFIKYLKMKGCNASSENPGWNEYQQPWFPR
jgi:hypothetical protein